MTPRRHIILAATILIVLWSGAAVAHWAFFDSHDLLASAHAALTHLLGSAVGTPASGRHMVWSTVVLALGFVARVYGFSVIALFAVKPYIDRRVREAYAYARISTGGDPISTSIRGRSAMN